MRGRRGVGEGGVVLSTTTTTPLSPSPPLPNPHQHTTTQHNPPELEEAEAALAYEGYDEGERSAVEELVW